MNNIVDLIAFIIIIIGAINWGTVGAFGVDLVTMATPGYKTVESGIKIAVGLAGIYCAYKIYTWKTKSHATQMTTPASS